MLEVCVKYKLIYFVIGESNLPDCQRRVIKGKWLKVLHFFKIIIRNHKCIFSQKLVFLLPLKKPGIPKGFFKFLRSHRF